MSAVQKAIEDITYARIHFPEEAFQTICENKEEAIPYLRAAIEYAIQKRSKVEDGYMLHLYSFFLLAQFQDREFFPTIVKFVTMPEDEMNYVIEDFDLELRDLLYNVYNGDLELLKKAIQNEEAGEFVRSGLLDVMGQLCLNGSLTKEELKSFLQKCVREEQVSNFFCNEIANIICHFHFLDLLPEIRYMLDCGLMDEIFMGKYDSRVDDMFNYRDDVQLCHVPINVVDILRDCVTFESDEDLDEDEMDYDEFEAFLQAERRELHKPIVKKKIGRNDPCPCGSGKKYKFCCMNKVQDPLDVIENAAERQKCLKNYPYTGEERIEGRLYLGDFFDPESIELDKILYLGLMRRPGFSWERDEELENRRKRAYLYLAFQKCAERMEREQIPSLAAFDEEYSIHYLSEEWLDELLELLRKENDRITYREVETWYREHY